MSGDNNTIRIRCRIIGTYKGENFTYEDPEGDEGSQFLHWEDENNGYDPSDYWWREGNFSCDCNRAHFVGEEDLPCGETIRIQRIEPIENNPLYPVLELDEE